MHNQGLWFVLWHESPHDEKLGLGPAFFFRFLVQSQEGPCDQRHRIPSFLYFPSEKQASLMNVKQKSIFMVL
uniref:Uncharacterized protein n=1 Tax=Anguilla anguilla TaxID=7936 RepID=A0A0E9XN64_ANGAN